MKGRARKLAYLGYWSWRTCLVWNVKLVCTRTPDYPEKGRIQNCRKTWWSENRMEDSRGVCCAKGGGSISAVIAISEVHEWKYICRYKMYEVPRPTSSRANRAKSWNKQVWHGTVGMALTGRTVVPRWKLVPPQNTIALFLTTEASVQLLGVSNFRVGTSIYECVGLWGLSCNDARRIPSHRLPFLVSMPVSWLLTSCFLAIPFCLYRKYSFSNLVIEKFYFGTLVSIQCGFLWTSHCNIDPYFHGFNPF